MARVTSPLLSLDASGSVGKAITFAKWRGRNYVRRLVVPANPKTPLQVAMRAGLRFVTQYWQFIDTADQNGWATLAAGDNITLLNASVRYNQNEVRQGRYPISSPLQGSQTTPSAPTDDSSVGGYRQITLNWAAGGNAPTQGWAIYRSEDTMITPGPATLIRMVDASLLSFIDTGLLDGTTYYYYIIGFNLNGEAGPASSEIEVTTD